jgi:RND superfamily putative drug exporter
VLTRLGIFIVRHRKAVLAGTAVFFAASLVFGGGVASKLISGGFEDPGAESTRASDAIAERFGSQQPDLLLLVRAKDGDVDDPAVAEAGRALTEELAAAPGVEQAASYWSLGAPPLRSGDGDQALVFAFLPGGEQDDLDAAEELSPRFTREDELLEVRVGGFSEVFRQANDQIEEDLLRAELIAFPITLVLMVFVFGSVVAASLPLLVGGVAIVGTFLVLAILASLTDVSIFALNLTTGMGLGLAIDYSLFVVSRFREEIGNGLAPHDAAVRTVQTAGKTIAFSALTVCVSLAAMLVFPLTFFRSFAYAGMGVSLIAGAAAVLFLPALLATLGPRVDSLRIFRRRERGPEHEGMWHRVATVVMRRPIPIATAVTAVLIVLGLPFLRIEFGLPDDRVLPEHLSSREVHDEIRENFDSQEQGAIQVVATDIGDPADRSDEIDDYAVALSQLDGISRVDAITGSYLDGTRVDVPDTVTARFESDGSTWLSVVPTVEPFSPDGERVAEAVRDTDAPFPVLVGGQPAELVDAKQSLFDRLPLAFGWIAIATFVLLFLMFGSVVVPLKALVLNILSLSATFGALVWIFQDGNLSGVLDFTSTGTIVASTPVLLFCVAFGLSMDYEVFLLSRIKEEHDRTGDNTQAVATGLERTGRIVTAAAVLISVVFISFATSGVTFIKIFGLGLSLAVLMDAFVIRATLVPAFMRIAGELNWWAPPFLRRLHDRIGISEVEAPPTPEVEPEREPVRSG